MADPKPQQGNPKVMSATQAKSALQGAQVPEHQVAGLEAKGISAATLWLLVSKLLSSPEALAALKAILALLFPAAPQGSPPKP